MATNNPKGVPLDQVKTMKAQGLENNQIIESLQREGFSSSQIFDALNQADLVPGSDLNVPDSQFGQDEDLGNQYSEEVPQESPKMDFQEHIKGHDVTFEQTNTEELVEAIIDEKWNDLVKDINKIIDWKNDTETKFIALEQKFEMLKEQFDKLHQAILGKIGEYDKHIMDVGAEVKAMEKVFSKVLPVFTENVHELSRITDEMKK